MLILHFCLASVPFHGLFNAIERSIQIYSSTPFSFFYFFLFLEWNRRDNVSKEIGKESEASSKLVKNPRSIEILPSSTHSMEWNGNGEALERNVGIKSRYRRSELLRLIYAKPLSLTRRGIGLASVPFRWLGRALNLDIGPLLEAPPLLPLSRGIR